MSHQELAQRYRSLKIERDEIAALYRQARNPKGKEKGLLHREEKEISLAGGRFSVVGELWVPSTILDISRVHSLAVDPLSAERYSDHYSEDLGIVAELYRDLSPRLQEALGHENRRASFKKIVCPASLPSHVVLNQLCLVSKAIKSGARKFKTCRAHICSANTRSR